jgi:hypothetical protein
MVRLVMVIAPRRCLETPLLTVAGSWLLTVVSMIVLAVSKTICFRIRADAFVFTILSAVAEAERDRIRERISVVKADQKARGAYLGGKVPFGFTVVDCQLEPVARQQAIIAQVGELRGEGKSLRAIKSALSLDLSLDAISRIASTNKERVQAEMQKSPGSARELSSRTGLTEKQVRSAIDHIRAAHGYKAVINNEGRFSMDSWSEA